jgi:hypothetical protein
MIEKQTIEDEKALLKRLVKSIVKDLMKRHRESEGKKRV